MVTIEGAGAIEDAGKDKLNGTGEGAATGLNDDIKDVVVENILTGTTDVMIAGVSDVAFNGTTDVAGAGTIWSLLCGVTLCTFVHVGVVTLADVIATSVDGVLANLPV